MFLLEISRDANTRRLNILLPKKDDLAKGLKCSKSGGLVNHKYWHVKDAAGDFFGAGVVKV